MAYQPDERPVPPTPPRLNYTTSNYGLPIVALIAIIGLGFGYYIYSNTASVPTATTIERTATPIAPASPAPAVPNPAPVVPK